MSTREARPGGGWYSDWQRGKQMAADPRPQWMKDAGDTRPVIYTAEMTPDTLNEHIPVRKEVHSMGSMHIVREGQSYSKAKNQAYQSDDIVVVPGHPMGRQAQEALQERSTERASHKAWKSRQVNPNVFTYYQEIKKR